MHSLWEPPNFLFDIVQRVCWETVYTEASYAEGCVAGCSDPLPSTDLGEQSANSTRPAMGLESGHLVWACGHRPVKAGSRSFLQPVPPLSLPRLCQTNC